MLVVHIYLLFFKLLILFNTYLKLKFYWVYCSLKQHKLNSLVENKNKPFYVGLLLNAALQRMGFP